MARAKPASDLFGRDESGGKTYSAKDIEVLEGLEPVRRRPGMYIGGTDARALHHLAAEILDNAMDEAVAGHASRIEMELSKDGVLTVRDNGRSVPTDPHPKLKPKSALEVIFTVLHAGGKFGGDAYQTSGGLHGVGASVVNALSEWLEVEVARDREAKMMRFERGHPVTKLKSLGAVQNRRGTIVRSSPTIRSSARKRISNRNAFTACAGRKRISFAASKSAGRAIPRSLRRTTTRPPNRHCTFRAASRTFWRAHWKATRSSRPAPSRAVWSTRTARQRRMGDRLGARARRLSQFLLQHDPDQRRRHARAGPARRAHAVDTRLRRARGQPEDRQRHA